MPVLLKDLIPEIMTTQEQWRVSLLKQWPVIVGSLQTRVRLEKIYDDTLIIGVYESHWMQELYLLSSVIVDAINDALPEPRIKHVRFKLVEEKTTRMKEMVKRAPFFLTPAKLNHKQEEALSGIHDEQLKKALTDFWSRCSNRGETNGSKKAD